MGKERGIIFNQNFKQTLWAANFSVTVKKSNQPKVRVRTLTHELILIRVVVGWKKQDVGNRDREHEWDFIDSDEETDYGDDWTDSKPKKPNEGVTIED